MVSQRMENDAGISACRNARNGHARARREHYCPPMSGVRLDASTAPAADRYWIDIKESPCRLSTITAQGNALQSVVVVLPLGSVIATRIFVAPGTPGRFAPMYTRALIPGCSPPTRYPGQEDRAVNPKNCPCHFHGVLPLADMPPDPSGPPEIIYPSASIPLRYVPSDTQGDPAQVPGFAHIALYR